MKQMTGSASEIVLMPSEQAYETGFGAAGAGDREDPGADRVPAGAGSA